MPAFTKNFSASTSGSPQRWPRPPSGTASVPTIVGERRGVRSRMAAPGDVGLGILGREIDETVGAERQADVAADRQALAVAFVVLAVLRGERPPSLSSLRMTLITPAIASEPYCAEAPSRSTSTRSIAAAGNAAKSTACEPWLTVPSGASCRFTSAERWRREPFISTSVWSGDRLRSVTGRMNAVPSAIGKRCVLSDGLTWQAVRQVERCLFGEQFAGQHVDRRQRLRRRLAALSGAGHQDFLEFRILRQNCGWRAERRGRRGDGEKPMPGSRAEAHDGSPRLGGESIFRELCENPSCGRRARTMARASGDEAASATRVT